MPAYTSSMDRRASESERQAAREIAQAVLERRTTILEAARNLYSLARTDAIADEDDRILITVIYSETDHLPLGEVRKLWAQDALEAKEAEITRCEELWKPQFFEACKRILGK